MTSDHRATRRSAGDVAEVIERVDALFTERDTLALAAAPAEEGDADVD